MGWNLSLRISMAMVRLCVLVNDTVLRLLSHPLQPFLSLVDFYTLWGPHKGTGLGQCLTNAVGGNNALVALPSKPFTSFRMSNHTISTSKSICLQSPTTRQLNIFLRF
jgi:hypothetical protein